MGVSSNFVIFEYHLHDVLLIKNLKLSLLYLVLIIFYIYIDLFRIIKNLNIWFDYMWGRGEILFDGEELD